MKVAPLHKELKRYPRELSHLICHTGQHYDEQMSKVFFDDLDLPKPDFDLGVGSASHAEQTAAVMVGFEHVALKESPDAVIVVGDVNSTIACALVAAKLGIRIAHVEAGLRSFDRSMPEEINRLLTDAISDFLFVTERSGINNLSKEGIPEDKVFFVGNVMIDTLVQYLPRLSSTRTLETLNLEPNGYVLATFHRPTNVDTQHRLAEIVELLNSLGRHKKVIFPVHPRTQSNLVRFSLLSVFSDDVHVTEPLGYIEFLKLIKESALVVTDSGGIQEETTFLGVPCITVRNSTERPVTITEGTNNLVGTDLKAAEATAREILIGGRNFRGRIPELWDGHAAERIASILRSRI